MAERLRWFQAPGAWLWIALELGAVVRMLLLCFTEGSFDVAIKAHHGRSVNEFGLLEYYRRSEIFNHPPLMGRFFAGLQWLAATTGAPFGLLLRAPFALLDLGSAWLLMRLFGDSPYRYAVLAGYWLSPVAILFSAYHGNTDSAIAFSVLLAMLAATRGRAPAAGAALGVGLWIKLPALIAAPALFFALPAWRDRLRFAVAALVVGAAGYLPSLLSDPMLLFERVVAYPGSAVETPSGIVIWGIANTLGIGDSAFAGWLAAHNTAVCWVPILAFAWLRRGAVGARDLGISVCGSFLILYGLTSFWAYQYLAWSAPLWFFLGLRFAAVASLLLGGYVYGVYALFTGSAFLVGTWDFVRHDPWPPLLTMLRDASVLLCFVSAAVLLGAAALREGRRRRPRPDAG